ncbi:MULTISPECIES: universal stress protein [Halomicrobium]|uniref:UspA domain protein n=2 Tax=Halomicrobium mukohataei TaxID=57705 RepID=C7P0Q1_HALMD|nr:MULTISPECIES: universal stress protein [Halomicrobium]ACV47033.1 UspA domain protein [Halomicrobium mukohataei DSM 12286]QCD65523.1 universal stress protein [Halomicrobium mukohataei]QFR20329.1 universal stress protein [Halomicrobium sp. ZPS1]
MRPSHVLVPLDGSPLSQAALSHALDVFDCPITVLNVVTPIDAAMSESGVLTDEVRGGAAREHAADVIDAAREQAAGTDQPVETVVEEGDPVETVVEEGDPAETIVAYAEANDADQIVMGGHGGGSDLAKRLLGTVATAVVREAPVTVTVVR